MKKEEFILYLNSPEKLSEQTINSLEQLASEFPYCSSIETLLTLNYFKEKNIRFENRLSYCAIKSENRKSLHEKIRILSGELTKIDLPFEFSDKHSKIQQTVTSKTITSVIDQQKKEPKEIKKDNILKTRIEEKLTQIERNKQEREKLNEKKQTEDVDLKSLYESNKIKSNSELIDQFIEKEPTISRIKAEFFDPLIKAKESITDKEDIISETLARIYSNQGYKEKAIKILKKLSLKFPEKSGYFAAQIKKIENEIKEQENN